MLNFLKHIFGKQEPAPHKVLDFSHIDSIEKVQEVAERGELYPILLFPEVFGGEAIEVNTVYVPSGIPETQNQIIGTIVRFVEEGLVDSMRVIPEYKGESYVPCSITIHTSKAGNPGAFNPTIEIW